MTSSIQKYLNQSLQAVLDVEISSLEFKSIGGGCINETFRVKLNGRKEFFLKLNSIERYPGLFEKEKHGIEFIAKQDIIQVPSVIVLGEVDNYQLLLLEWIEGGIKTDHFWKLFGEQVAALHRQTWVTKNGHASFGFVEDNYMGSLTQNNDQCQDWNDFFVNARLDPQIKLATENHLLDTKHVDAFENLFTRVPEIFNPEQSALLHGDLWSGNFMCNGKSEAVLIDPAVYFGHRSMDLAMTTLFGGFDRIFYESYEYHFPFPKNYREQWDICNLYPLLIHLNLFGLSYLGQIETILRKWN